MGWERRSVLIGGHVKFADGRWTALELQTLEGKRVYIRYYDEALGELRRMSRSGEATVSETYLPEAWTDRPQAEQREKIATLTLVREGSAEIIEPEAAAVIVASVDEAAGPGADKALVPVAVGDVIAVDESGVVAVAGDDAPFDYGEVGIEERLAIQHSERVIDDNIAAIKTSTITIGRELRAVRAKLQHGQWMRWLKTRRSFSHDTALNFMAAAALADSFPQFAMLETMFSRTALRDLASDKLPDEVRIEALRRAGLGEKITPTKVAGIIGRFAPEIVQPASKGSAAPDTRIKVLTDSHGAILVEPVERRGDVALMPVMVVQPGGELAPSVGEFNITYVPTGQALGSVLTNERKARLMLDSLAAEVDWASIIGGVMPPSVKRKIRSILNINHQATCPVPPEDVEALNERLWQFSYSLLWNPQDERFQLGYPQQAKFEFFEPDQWAKCQAFAEALLTKLSTAAAQSGAAQSGAAQSGDEAVGPDTALVQTVVNVTADDIEAIAGPAPALELNATFDLPDDSDAALYGDMELTALPGVTLPSPATTQAFDQRTRVIILSRLGGQYQESLAALSDVQVRRIAASLWSDGSNPWYMASRQDHERAITSSWIENVAYELDSNDRDAVAALADFAGVLLEPFGTVGAIPTVDAPPPDDVSVERGSEVELIHHRVTGVEYLINVGRAAPAFNLAELEAVGMAMQRAAEIIEEPVWEWLLQRVRTARAVLQEAATSDAGLRAA